MSRRASGRPPFGQIIAALIAALLAPLAAHGGGVAPCEDPFIYPGAAVNVLVLPFRHAGPEGTSELPETGKRLATLVKLEVLFSLIKYGSIGAVVLEDYGGGDCNALEVLRRVDVADGRALVMIWGRLFEQRDQIYVQTYVRFLRQDRSENWVFALESGEGSPYEFTASFPATSFAFAPRRLSRADLEAIEAEFGEAAQIRPHPDLSAPGEPLVPEPGMPFAYYVTDAEYGWMKIEGSDGRRGWIRARTGADWPLRRKLPELAMIDALAGYLRLRVGLEPFQLDAGHTGQLRMEDEEARKRQAPPATAEHVRTAIATYRKHAGAARSKTADATASVIEGMLELTPWRRSDPPMDLAARRQALIRARTHFERAAQTAPYDSATRNLTALTGVLDYAHFTDDPAPVRQAVERMLEAVSLDPDNLEALTNLRNCYAYLQQRDTDSPAWGAEELERRLDQINGVHASVANRQGR